MKQKTIIIDAAHREETRIAVLEDGTLQDFNREAFAIKRIKSNIYLAKVTRVEQSLQACFVDYGSDRHGFLPFSDIHPNYYQIDEEEKARLLETANKQQEKQEEENDSQSSLSKNDRSDDNGGDSIVTGSYSLEDETEDDKIKTFNIYKKYNIQDVIKPGQLILIQVAKEERGNKGASMTTYISIAGRYCVLMANSPNKGGVSKKVDNFRDRKLLRSIINDLEVPNDRSVIIRTAGVGKKPEEIKLDYEYLSNLWSNITEMAESSNNPCFIHAEDDIIRKCIRDVYNDATKELIVEGQEAYDSIQSFIKLTSSKPKNNIKLYQNRVPIFNRYGVEQQISKLYDKEVSLPSGGSIVIDHTEALVAIDVNSKKSNKESGVEQMALKTNLEAAKEISRQLKLRDLAGLIVIDFIDMYDQKNRRSIERALRDELQDDRARIQIGRISIFGLLELSRQRLGASFFETITQPCSQCLGTGYVRSVEILAVSILRAIRHSCNDQQAGVIYIYTTPNVISYMMNFKKNEISKIEQNYGINILIHPSEEVGSSGFAIKKRKELSEEERREIEMEVKAAKINQDDLQKNFFSNHALEAANDSSDDRDNNIHGQYKRGKKRNNRRRDNRRYKNQEVPQKNDGFVGSLFSIFKK